MEEKIYQIKYFIGKNDIAIRVIYIPAPNRHQARIRFYEYYRGYQAKVITIKPFNETGI